jgi:hypothetical protein
MATVHVQNPSAAIVQVTLAGQEGQSGVVGPRAAVDLVVAPGRYNISLHGASRTQRFYDAPLSAGDVLELVYSDQPAERPATPAGGE